MIKVQIVEDNKLAEELCQRAELSLTDTRFVMAAEDRGEILAFSVFSVENNEMMLEYLFPKEDALMADAIIRSTLHIAATRNLREVYYGEKCSEKLLSVLRFIKDKDKKTLDLSKLFEDSCSGCK